MHTLYECCGFGYTLHEQHLAAGAHSLVTTPMWLNLERRRKNARMDARELCVRLSRYLDGYRHELRPVRSPSRAEQQRRKLGRQREFWKKELHRLENHGRALRICLQDAGGWQVVNAVAVAAAGGRVLRFGAYGGASWPTGSPRTFSGRET